MKNSNYQLPLLIHQDVLKFWKDNNLGSNCPRMIVLLLSALIRFVILKKKISKTRERKAVSRKVRTMLGMAAVIADFSPCNYPNAFQSGKRNLRRYCKRKTVDERYEATDCNVDKHSVGCCGAAEVVEGQREFGSMS